MHNGLYGILPKTIHTLAEGFALYEAYGINNFVFTTSVAILAYAFPAIHMVQPANAVFAMAINYRGLIIGSVYTAYWGYQTLPGLTSYNKTEL